MWLSESFLSSVHLFLCHSSITPSMACQSLTLFYHHGSLSEYTYFFLCVVKAQFVPLHGFVVEIDERFIQLSICRSFHIHGFINSVKCRVMMKESVFKSCLKFTTVISLWYFHFYLSADLYLWKSENIKYNGNTMYCFNWMRSPRTTAKLKQRVEFLMYYFSDSQTILLQVPRCHVESSDGKKYNIGISRRRFTMTCWDKI